MEASHDDKGFQVYCTVPGLREPGAGYGYLSTCNFTIINYKNMLENVNLFR